MARIGQLLFTFRIERITCTHKVIQSTLNQRIFRRHVVLVDNAHLQNLTIRTDGRNHRNDGVDLCQRGYRDAQPENGNGLDAIEVERTVAFLLGFLTFAQGLAAQLFVILKRLVH